MAKKETKSSNNIQPGVAAGSLPTNSSGWPIGAYRTQMLLLAIISLLFYGNTFTHEAAFDDQMAIASNEYVQQGLAGIPTILTTDAYQSYLEQKNGGNQLEGGRYRPLSLVTFAIEQELLGVGVPENMAQEAAATRRTVADVKEAKVAADMHSRHVVNVLLYLCAVCALLHFLRQIVFPGNELLPFLAVLIFTIHPIHTEVVANVKSRDEILSVLFISLTFVKAFRYYDHKKRTDLVYGLLFFFFALLSKEYAVTLVALLPLAFFLFRGLTLPVALRATVPYALPLVLYFLLRMASVTEAPEGAAGNVLNNPYLFATAAQKLASQFLVLLRYVQLLVLPAVLCADYSFNALPYADFSSPAVWLAIVLHVGMLVAFALLLRRRQVLSFALALYILPLLLVSNFIVNIGAPMGERLVFHSSIGFSILLAAGLYKVFVKPGQEGKMSLGLTVTLSVLVLLGGYKTIARNSDWKNTETLFMADVQKVPGSVTANNNAAAACMNFAKRATDGQERKKWFLQAISYYNTALQVLPTYNLARLNRGLCHYNMGHPELALPDWDTVRRNDPTTQKLDNYLNIAGRYFYSQGMRYEQTRQADSAVWAFTSAAMATPSAPEPWIKLGYWQLTVGRKIEARQAATKALQLAPANTDAQQVLSAASL